MRLVIEIPEETYDEVRHYGLNLCPRDKEALKKALKTCTPLPKDATNGDIIKAMFPSMETFRTSDVVEIRYKVHDEVWCVSALDNVWWDEPYKRGGEDGEDSAYD